MFSGVLSIMPCATAVNNFLGVLCATFGVSCSTKCSTMWTLNFFVSLLSSIIIIIYSLKTPQVRKTYYIVYYIHTNVSQIRNITVYVLKAGQ